jgi:Uma2 family endonuclease
MTMPTTVPPILDEVRYYNAAQEYLRKLPLEHFMEPTSQARQREITLESLALVHALRPEVQVFNELLVQYPRPRKKKPGQVVPDNMVVIHSEPIEAEGSYDVPLQPARPFWMLEYVSKGSKRKDYVDNMHKYEHELKVPYYLLFDPKKKKLTLYRHTGKAFARVEMDELGRYPIEELDVSVSVLDGWVRFWYQGELLPLPAELQNSLVETRKERDESRKQLAAAEREIERLRAQVQELKSRQGNGRK